MQQYQSIAAGQQTNDNARIRHYLTLISQAIQQQDSLALANLTHHHLLLLQPSLLPDLASPSDLKSIARGPLVSQILSDPYDMWIKAFLGYLSIVRQILVQSDHSNLNSAESVTLFNEAYTSLALSFNYFSNNVLGAQWHVPTLKSLLSGLVSISLHVDRELVKLKNKPKHAIHAQNTMARLLAIVLSERPSVQDVKEAILLIANSCFRLYFAMDELHLGPNIVSQVEGVRARKTVDFTRFPLSQRVAYHYYVGRMKLNSHCFDEAAFHLSFAFRYTPNALKQKRTICLYLMVANLPRGRLPSPALLGACPSLLLSDMMPCITGCDFKAFYQCLQRHQDYAIAMNIYMILKERIRLYMSFLVIRRTYRLLSSSIPSLKGLPGVSGNHCPILYIAQALSLATGEETSVMDAECILASLIEQGFVRGYLMHEGSFIVFSKLDPFPSFYGVCKKREGEGLSSFAGM